MPGDRLTNRLNRYIILKDRAEKPCFALFRRSAIGFDRFYLYRARNAYDTRACVAHARSLPFMRTSGRCRTRLPPPKTAKKDQHNESRYTNRTRRFGACRHVGCGELYPRRYRRVDDRRHRDRRGSCHRGDGNRDVGNDRYTCRDCGRAGSRPHRHGGNTADGGGNRATARRGAGAHRRRSRRGR